MQTSASEAQCLLLPSAEVAESKVAKTRKQLEAAKGTAWLTKKQRSRLRALLIWSLLLGLLLLLVLIGAHDNQVSCNAAVRLALLPPFMQIGSNQCP